jgi:hypothetical protein
VEELPAQVVARRGRGRVPFSTTLASVALVALLAAGFGVLGGRREVSPSSGPGASQPAAAVSSASVATGLTGSAATPATTPAQPCGAVPDRDPGLLLVVDGSLYPGVVQAAPEASSRTPIDLPAGANVEVWTEGNACAIGWHIALAIADRGGLEPLALQPNPRLDPALASQNRFLLALTPFRFEEGDVEVRAALDFPDRRVVATWPIRFVPFERPRPRLVVAGRNEDLPTIEGCETVLIFANGWEEPLPDCDQDLASQLPSATPMRTGTALELDFGDWTITQLEVLCGAASDAGFVAQPEPGCRQEPQGTWTFVAPKAGDWTLAMAACAVDGTRFIGNSICGTWYARVDTR